MILVLSAFPAELKGVLARMHAIRKSFAAPKLPLSVGTLAGVEIAAASVGIGKLNGYASLEALIACCTPDMVIQTGICGAADSKISVGDFVVSTRILAYDLLLVQQEHSLPNIPGTAGLCDEAAACSLACAATARYSVVSGPTGSADLFYDRRAAERYREVMERHGILSVDMESSGTAASAERNTVPYGQIRFVSDTPDAPMVREVVKTASHQIGEVLERFVRQNRARNLR